MPAINLAVLHQQTEGLISKVEHPQKFISSLTDILDYYTNRTIRPSQKAIRTYLPGFETPESIIRHIVFALSPIVVDHPDKTIDLIKALWDEGHLEMRIIAAKILGRIPSQHALSLLSKLPEWMNQTSDEEIQQALLTDSLDHIREKDREAFLAILENWLKDKHYKVQIWGLKALIPHLRSRQFENLPTAFRLLRPIIEKGSPTVQIELQVCIQAMESISEVETSHYLQEIIASNPNPQMKRTLLRMLPALSLHLQTDLRGLLRTGQ